MNMPEPTNAQKQRHGLSRMWHAFGYSMAGLRAGWQETALRQEMLAAAVLLPLSTWLGRTWVEVVLLAGSVLAENGLAKVSMYGHGLLGSHLEVTADHVKRLADNLPSIRQDLVRHVERWADDSKAKVFEGATSIKTKLQGKLGMGQNK